MVFTCELFLGFIFATSHVAYVTCDGFFMPLNLLSAVQMYISNILSTHEGPTMTRMPYNSVTFANKRGLLQSLTLF